MTRVAAAAVLPLLLAAPARAQVAVSDRLHVSMGATDNASGAALTEDSARRAYGFLTAANTLTALIPAGRTDLEGTHTIGATTYADPDTPATVTNTLALSARFDLGGSSTLGLAARGTHAHMSTGDLLGFGAASARDQARMRAELALRPTGSFSYLQGELEERFEWSPDPRWTVEQTLRPEIYAPLGELRDLERYTGASLGARVRRRWTADAVGADVTVGYRRLSTTLPGEDAATTSHPHHAYAGAAWQRELGPYLGLEAGAGALAYRADGGAPVEVAPAGAIGLRWARSGFEATLGYARSVTAARLVAGMFVDDSVSAGAAGRWGKLDAWGARLNAFFSHGRPVTGDARWSGTEVYGGGAALDWRPWAGRSLQLELQYYFTRQETDATVMDRRLAPMQRHALSAGVSVGVPWLAPG